MDHVTVVGRLNPDEVVMHLRDHDIGLVPMITSSMTNKMFDYIASYLPILALGDNDTSRHVLEHDFGWTASFDAREIGTLLDKIEPISILAKSKNIQAARCRFTTDAFLAKFVDMLERLVRTRRAS